MKYDFKKRNNTIAWMQIVGCFLVIFGHSYPFVTQYPNGLHELQIFIYQFHMPLFVFCSGILLALSEASEKYTFLQYMKRRALRLLLPYFSFSIIGIIPKVLFSSVLNDTMTFSFFEILRAFFLPRNNIWGHFWFLPMLFILGLLGYALQRWCKSKWLRYIALLISFGALFVPKLTDWLCVNDLLDHVFYFILGINIAALFSKEVSFGSIKSCMIGLAGILMSVMLFFLHIENGVLSTLKSTAIACMMIAALMLLIHPLSRREKSIPPLLRRTFSIFILSWPCQLVVEVVLERLFHLEYYIIMPCMLFAGIFIPCGLILLIDRIEMNRKYKPITRIIGG